MKFSTTAAFALAAGASAQDWSSDTATSSTTTSTTTTTTSGWDWPDPSSSTTTTTTTGDWEDWTTSSSCSSSTTTTSASIGWSSKIAPFDPSVCSASSTATVWKVGPSTVTGTDTVTVYQTGAWSALTDPVTTSTATVTVWVMGDGSLSTAYGTPTEGAWTAGGTAYGSVSTVTGGQSTYTATGGWPAGAPAVSTDGGAWPAESDPAAWGPSVISVVGTDGGAGWQFTDPVPTQTGWGSTNQTGSPSCAGPEPTATDSGCNTASNRGDWCDGFSKDTDYYQNTPSTGNVCSYNFVITNGTANFDGTDVLSFLINGQSPGPLIECNWGDTVSITVTNNLENNGTAIHWHGIRQKGTNNMDGVPGVTECALAPGQTRTYTWVASSYGTSWYHSHWLTQYGDGIRGPIIIHGPATANYDIDMGVVMLSDTFNTTAAQANDIISHTGPGGTVNVLFNGHNVRGNAGEHALWQVQPGKSHLFRFINSAAQNMYSFHFDNHTMEVISVDFVPIVPYTTDWVNIGIGQRFEVIVTANQPSGNYFIRAVTQTGCPSECDNNGLGTANAIMQYTDATLALPVSSFGNKTIADFAFCADEPYASTVPYLSKEASPDGTSSGFSSQASTLPAGNVALVQTSDDGLIFRWFLNGGSINVNYTAPTLQNLAEGNNASSNVAVLNNGANTWVYFVIQNQFFAAHPIHLHGHDFSVLGYGAPSTGAPVIFSAADVPSLDFTNPVRRDTAMLGGNSWTVIGFETDNPGAWLMHCHIVWHVDGGLAMQFIERPDAIDAGSYVTDNFQNECAAYAAYQAADPSHLKTSGESGLRKRYWYEPNGPSDNVVRRSESHEKRFLESHLKRDIGDGFRPRHAGRR